MTDDATTWVTLKVPEADREQAEEYKPDGSTWGDCVVQGAEALNDAIDSDVPNVAEPEFGALLEADKADIHELKEEIRKAQELAEQARDAAQRVEEGMGR